MEGLKANRSFRLKTGFSGWALVLGLSLVVLSAEGKDYFGKVIGNFNNYAHKVSGKVFAVDEDTIFIKGFSYDGLGPDAYFWVGKDNQPSPSGVIVPYPDDYTDKEPPVLRNFDKEDVLLQLPPGYKLKDIKWLSVWCRRFTVNFGEVYIPSTLDPPKRKVLPEFTREAHGVKSGNITILDAKTFYIPNLHYDGAGPDAFFWVGTGPRPHSGGRKIPNEKGSTDVLSGYEGEDIELTLPGDLTVHDIDWLSMWCISYKHNFGHVLIPKNNLNVPPSLGQYRTVPFTGNFPQYATPRPTVVVRKKDQKKKKGTEFKNCKELSFSNKDKHRVQIQWEKDRNMVKFKVSARITELQYVALGFSPVKGRAKMVGGDAIVVYYTPTERKKFHAVDYYMTAQSQCDGKDGVCPDTRLGGKNDVMVIAGDRKNGFTTVMFERPINTRESKYDIALDEEVNLMIAIGNLNRGNEANFHHGERTSPEEDIRISVHSTDDHTCLLGDDFPNMKVADSDSNLKPWIPSVIEGSQNFTVQIGPTGGKRGYTAITGEPSWGIAWWVNDLLIPEIYVERGKTYTFKVQGGDDPKNPSKYHPLYITDSPEGGFGQKSEYQQRQQRVFAGVGYDSSGYPYPTAFGQYCEYEHKTVDKSAQSESFEDYKKTLRLVCNDEGKPGYLIWTVEQDTPDTVYYQCYTHNNLGWKIHVVNPGFRLRRDSYSSTSILSQSLFLVISTAICWTARSVSSHISPLLSL